jgi:hypothetical protein
MQRAFMICHRSLGRELEMFLLRALVVASLFLGISSVAAAAPVSVTYGFAGAGGGGDASFGIAGSGGSGSGSGTAGNVVGGTITIVYGSGSGTPNGTVGPMSQATHASMLLSATGVSLYLGVGTFPVSGWAVGNLTIHTPILGFNGAFSIPPPAAPVTITASAAVAVFNVGPGLIVFNGFGNMWIPALGEGPFTWEVDNGGNGNTFGQEINRTVIPEPTTGLLVFAGLAGLGIYGGRRSIRR